MLQPVVREALTSLTSYCTEYDVPAPAFNSSALVLADFKSPDPCWFDLRPDTGDCGDNSPPFTLFPDQRHQSESKTTIGLLASTSTRAASTSTGHSSGVENSPNDASNNELSSGAKAGIALSVVCVILILLGISAYLYFRRKKEQQDKGVFGGHRKESVRFFGWAQSGGSNISSSSLQALQSVQPVYDGIPGSTGYDDDARWIGSSAPSHSSHSLRSSSNQGYTALERDELEVTRTKLDLEEARRREAIRIRDVPGSSSIVSYGPNPLIPSISPRPSTIIDTPTHTPIYPLHEPSIEDHYAPAVQKSPSAYLQDTAPAVQISGTARSYSQVSATCAVLGAQSLTVPAPQPDPMDYHGSNIPDQHPPRSAPSTVISYGPNRITPTPPFAVTPVGPPGTLPIASQQHHNETTALPVLDLPCHPSTSHEPPGPTDHNPDRMSFSKTMTPGIIQPLPPYASETDYHAMQKGAIRRLDEPKAAAELPPTKDGYYQDSDRTYEYELQGTGLGGEPQRPHNVGIGRDMIEQKFLLGDADMSKLKEMKATKRAEADSFEMQPAASSFKPATGETEHRMSDHTV